MHGAVICTRLPPGGGEEAMWSGPLPAGKQRVIHQTRYELAPLKTLSQTPPDERWRSSVRAHHPGLNREAGVRSRRPSSHCTGGQAYRRDRRSSCSSWQEPRSPPPLPPARPPHCATRDRLAKQAPTRQPFRPGLLSPVFPICEYSTRLLNPALRTVLLSELASLASHRPLYRPCGSNIRFHTDAQPPRRGISQDEPPGRPSAKRRAAARPQWLV
jgi:hypothetical protein